MENLWPYSYVQKRTLEATIEARQQQLRPATASEVVKNYRTAERFNIPFLGDYVPEGWKEITPDGAVYVKTTGSALNNTMTQAEFLQRARDYDTGDETYGFGVMEQGQYKVLIALYRKEANDEKKR